MRSTIGIVVAVILGVVLAAGTAVAIVSVSKQTPSNTSPVDAKAHPKILYGSR